MALCLEATEIDSRAARAPQSSPRQFPCQQTSWEGPPSTMLDERSGGRPKASVTEMCQFRLVKGQWRRDFSDLHAAHADFEGLRITGGPGEGLDSAMHPRSGGVAASRHLRKITSDSRAFRPHVATPRLCRGWLAAAGMKCEER